MRYYYRCFVAPDLNVNGVTSRDHADQGRKPRDRDPVIFGFTQISLDGGARIFVRQLTVPGSSLPANIDGQGRRRNAPLQTRELRHPSRQNVWAWCTIGCILHSDRGSQFRSRRFVRALDQHRIVGPTGRVGATGRQRGHRALLQPAAEKRPRSPGVGHPRGAADLDRNLGPGSRGPTTGAADKPRSAG